MTHPRPTPAAIRSGRENNPKTRERDFARMLGITEADLVSAYVGDTSRRLRVDMDHIFSGLAAVGEVMALTRNESAVHEKIGVFEGYHSGKHAAMMLSENIDTRMFPKHFVHGFEVVKPAEKGVSRSIQIFDSEGHAVHKVHARPNTNIDRWNALIEPLVHEDQSQVFAPVEIGRDPFTDDPQAQASNLRKRWEKMTDTHQFVFIIKKLKMSRLQAVQVIGEDFAWPLYVDSVEAMLRHSANQELPIMCFVGNTGCIQIHSGPIKNIKPMGAWLNVMDPNFHLHLRMDQITEAWAVRKPTDKGHVTSIEAYNAAGDLIIQFFGKRIEGQDERSAWREIVENLPRIPVSQVA